MRGRVEREKRKGIAMPKNKVGKTGGGEIMDIRDAARYLLISTDTLYKYAISGFVPAFKLGNRWRFRKSTIDNWMKELESSEEFRVSRG